jgi:hypothetical protein
MHPSEQARSRALVLLAAALLASPVAAQELAPEKSCFPPCPPPARLYVFDCYHDFAEVETFLREAVRNHPDLATLESIGKSYQGRDIWVLTVTDLSTGDPEDKAAIWVDGGIDSDEVVATETALGLIHRLLTSEDPSVRDLLRTRTFYVAPNVMPDASELQHRTPIRPRDTTLRPWDEDGDGLADEDPPEDLDGDGQALQMRQQHPLGRMVLDEEDPRLMRPRRAGDEGPFFRVYSEGIDNDGDGRFQEDRFGGVDPNRNYPGNWSAGQGGSGPFAGSESGIRALYDFALAHPNIAASQHLHSTGGVLLRPPSVPDLELAPADERLYLDLSRLGLEITGYDLATSVYDWNWPRGSANRKGSQVWRDADGDLHGSGLSDYPAFGGSIDGMYLTFGVLAFANEIYAMGRDYDGDGEVDDHERLRYSDEVMDGYAFREWTAYDHPQLGSVEIGGWRKFGLNNPPPSELPREVERNVDFVLAQAEHMPRLAVADVEVEDLSGGVFRVKAKVRNVSLQPTELAVRLGAGTAVPVRVRLEGAEVLAPEGAVHELEVLQGYGEADVSWVVRAASGTELVVEARHPKGGVARGTITVR